MTGVTGNNYQNGCHSGVQELETFENKALVCFTEHPIPSAVSLHFERMIQLVGIKRVLNNSTDRIEQVYVVELEEVSSVEF